MQPKQPIIYVAAGVLEREDGSVFLVQRPLHKEMGGLWEIPGGKIEVGETPEETLIRELKEELDIQISVHDLSPLTFVSHVYEKFHLLMLVFLCRKWTGTITLRENQETFEWVKPLDLNNYLMPDADKPLIEVLQKRK
ncbi:MAG: 8-oxo-dGTP diphosphatase MutT [Alphaproteobacteria bacterium]|nr:8-oxo-dGTP diphosphatase MutT [Alphaproteobacteria bacterium]